MRRYEQLSLLLGDLIATHHTNYNLCFINIFLNNQVDKSNYLCKSYWGDRFRSNTNYPAIECSLIS
ncbi:MAG: hypothetical protein HC789_23480, partial [Microcoleus sp. CSU_2_2]|nr:hypothetical protein [Microcoleus sp. CSU_2_2]